MRETHAALPAGQVVDRWRSRTATLYRIRTDAHPEHDVVAKVLDDPRHAPALAASMSELADLLSQDMPREFVPMRPLSASAAAGCVVMPYVDGPSLTRIIQNRSGAPMDRDGVLSLVRKCGRLLAGYHARFSDASPARMAEARTDFDARLVQVLGTPRTVPCALAPQTVSRTFGDCHPGHVLVASDGRLAVIDPPIVRQYVFVARDIAWFIDRMLMAVITPRSVLTGRARAESHCERAAAFVAGYSEVRAGALSDADRLTIDVYLAFLLKRRLRKLVNARTARVFYYAAPLLYQHRLVTSRLRTALNRPSPVPIAS
jgi:Ser/Thr protein kinase RdoA (MazF antagonist)